MEIEIPEDTCTDAESDQITYYVASDVDWVEVNEDGVLIAEPQLTESEYCDSIEYEVTLLCTDEHGSSAN